MSKGLVKAKKYDWKDSNMALFGSDTEKQVKKESAMTEPAWEGAGQEVGLKIWRINNFQVESWPEEDYGEFYNGDSYIILNTWKDEESEDLMYDVHFWIGKNSSQDEYGTAAYKTVELDTLLDDKPIQHREVMDHESSLFKSYFKQITIMEGGADSGFRHVPQEEYQSRLSRFAKDSSGSVKVKQLCKAKSLVTENDVFILDCGNQIYQYNGSECSPFEKSMAMQYVGKIKEKRGGEVNSTVLEGGSVYDSHPFWQEMTEEEGDPDSDDEVDDGKKLLRVLINTDSKDTEVVKEDEYSMDDLKSDDVFIVDSGSEVFVWIGADASQEEKRNGIPYAHNYLRESGFPWRSISVVKEGGQKCKSFESAMAA